jgi:hypothetical protein
MSDDPKTDSAGRGSNGQTPPPLPPPLDEAPEPETPKGTPIMKPAAGDMERFKSKRGAKGAGVVTLQTALPHHPLKDAGDFTKLHPDEEAYWSDELCFVNVPIKGMKRDLLHLIDEDLVPPSVMPQVKRFRLALATKPNDTFYLCHIPSQNLENGFNATSLQAAEMGKRLWVKAVREDQAEVYTISFSEDVDAFPEPKWPKQTIYELIAVTFGKDRCIDHDDHPALRRLRGKKQSVA